MTYLDGKTAVVTGAASGIGEATARELARNGVKVLIADVKDGTAVASDVGGIFLEVDVTEADQVGAAVGHVVDEWGRLDIMVCNAGINRDGVIWKMNRDNPRETWSATMIPSAVPAATIT